MSNVITVAAPSWKIADSYGRVALETQRSLERLGWIVNTIGNEPPKDEFIPTLLNIMIGYPTSHAAYGEFINAGVKIALTMWESTEFPAEWRDPLNACERVVVPCQWNVDVFQNCGVTVPVERVPLGVSAAFHYQPRKPHQKFRFIAISDWDGRKGWDKAFFAFVRAFGMDEAVELVLKSRRIAKNFGNPNVQTLLEDLSDDEMQAFYASADCMIFPAAGEGFGLPPREFAVSGGIALATDYGGTKDNLSEWGIPVPLEAEVPAWSGHPKFEGLGMWGDADVEKLAHQLRAVRAMPLEQRNRIGAQFSSAASRLYSWDRFGEQLSRILSEVTDGYRVPA